MTERRSYAELSASARSALTAYMAANCETPEDVRDAMEGVSFELGLMPAQDLVERCWNAPSNTMRDEYPDWQAYHEWYCKAEKDEDYRSHMTGMWPVILCNDEGILDGWHRFHWYLRQGVNRIPTLRMI